MSLFLCEFFFGEFFFFLRFFLRGCFFLEGCFFLSDHPHCHSTALVFSLYSVRTDSSIMEDAVRAFLQQQVNALMNQNAALEAQLVGQKNIAQDLAELLGAITTVLSRSQAPMRRMLSIRKDWESRQCSQAEKNTSMC